MTPVLKGSEQIFSGMADTLECVLANQKASMLKETVKKRLMMEYLFVQNRPGYLSHHEGLHRAVSGVHVLLSASGFLKMFSSKVHLMQCLREKTISTSGHSVMISLLLRKEHPTKM